MHCALGVALAASNASSPKFARVLSISQSSPASRTVNLRAIALPLMHTTTSRVALAVGRRKCNAQLALSQHSQPACAFSFPRPPNKQLQERRFLFLFSFPPNPHRTGSETTLLKPTKTQTTHTLSKLSAHITLPPIGLLEGFIFISTLYPFI